MKNNAVSLLVNELRYEGWTEIRVTRDINRAAADFSLTVTERWAGQLQPVRIRPGDTCRVKIGEDLVLTGQVDDVSPSYDARSHSVTIAGRSRTAQLVDCSASEIPGQIFRQKIEWVAEHLAKPYGVEVVAAVDTGPGVPVVQIYPGESVFEVIERHARPKGLLVTDDAKGRLVLTRAGTERMAGGIALGVNALSGRANFTMRDRYTDYVVKGQRPGEDGAGTARDFAGSVGRAQDPQVPLGRRLLIVAENPGDSIAMRSRAAWESATRAGRALQAEYRLVGWRDAKGALLRPNTLARVKDDWLGIERDLLITAVTVSLADPGGSTAALTLMPPEAFVPQPEVPDALGNGITATQPTREARPR